MRAAALTAIALAMLLAGCGSVDGPKELQQVGAGPADQTRRVTCRLDSEHGEVRFVMDLPRGFVDGGPDGRETGGCLWHRPVVVPDQYNEGETFDSDIVLEVESVSDDISLDAVYDDQEGDAVDGDTADGDDSILHLKRTRGVKTFGDTVGDRLSYLCFCDGQNNLGRYAEADGVLLSWGADEAIQEDSDRQLAAVLASAGKLP